VVTDEATVAVLQYWRYGVRSRVAADFFGYSACYALEGASAG
jgi:hypothetical protein